MCSLMRLHHSPWLFCGGSVLLNQLSFCTALSPSHRGPGHTERVRHIVCPGGVPGLARPWEGVGVLTEGALWTSLLTPVQGS